MRKASGLSKKKVEKLFQTKTSYKIFGPPIRRFRRLQFFFSKYTIDLIFVEKLASRNNTVEYLLVAVEIFFEIFQMKTKYAKRHFQ